MSEETEQQTLSETDVSSGDKTVQEKILTLYKSEKLSHTVIGFWAKFLVETSIVAVPIFIFTVFPGVLIVFFNLYSIGYLSVVGAWVTFTVTIVGFTWCFTHATETEEE